MLPSIHLETGELWFVSGSIGRSSCNLDDKSRCESLCIVFVDAYVVMIQAAEGISIQGNFEIDEDLVFKHYGGQSPGKFSFPKF